MDNSDFFSKNRYLYLPSKSNPKVALVLDDVKCLENAFKLYNPFSIKAKILKSVLKFLFVNFNFFLKYFFTRETNLGEFVRFIKNEFSTDIYVSQYFATEKDKIVLQVQSTEAKILAYIKFPLSEVGEKRISNEIKAIELLCKRDIISRYIFTKKYKNVEFVCLTELKGDISKLSDVEILPILDSFKSEQSFILKEHPRVLSLEKSLCKTDFKSYENLFKKILFISSESYLLVYEHGDFAPWNLVKDKDKLVPFDFEYFVEDGLEYFDNIKYFYQVGKLLNSLTPKDLIFFIQDRVKHKEILLLLSLFVIKELLSLSDENEERRYEEEIFEILEEIV